MSIAVSKAVAEPHLSLLSPLLPLLSSRSCRWSWWSFSRDILLHKVLLVLGLATEEEKRAMLEALCAAACLCFTRLPEKVGPYVASALLPFPP